MVAASSADSQINWCSNGKEPKRPGTTRLAEMICSYQQGGGIDSARRVGATIEGDRVYLTVQVRSERRDVVQAAVHASGGRSEGYLDPWLYVYVPLPGVAAIAQHPDVRFIDLGAPLRPAAMFLPTGRDL
jgi:hypothetical protein